MKAAVNPMKWMGLLCLLTLFMTLSAAAQSWQEMDVMQGGVTGSWLGYQVAISGDHAIAGAPYEDTGGLNDAGAVYFYRRNPATGRWQETQKITGPAANAFMGISVAMDGDRALVGVNGEFHSANSAGSAYIYHRNGGTGLWEFHQRVVAPDPSENDHFGRSVAISGNHAVISAHFDGEDESGTNTMTQAGSAYFFELNSGTGQWEYRQKVSAPPTDRRAYDYFGLSVALSGSFVIIGANGHDADFGSKNNAGAAYIYEHVAGTWNHVAKIAGRAAFDNLGYCVHIHGNVAVAGAYLADKDGTDVNSGEAWLSVRDVDTGVWGTPEILLPADETDRKNGNYFGVSVAVQGDRIMVGATGEDYDGRSDAGSVYVFDFAPDSGWQQTERIRPGSTPASDNYKFGYSVSVEGDQAVVGTYAANGEVTFLEFSGGLLPVTWGAVMAHFYDGGVRLNWSTMSELNNDFFEIERSRDGVRFQRIGMTFGAGTSKVPFHYTFTDSNPLMGPAWYRLRQVDFDGHSGYSPAVAVVPGQEDGFGPWRIYPNPAMGQVDVYASQGIAGIELRDRMGALVKTVGLTGADLEYMLLIHDLPEGLYMVGIRTFAGKMIHSKLVIGR